jgi:hypothetical protein
METTLNIQVDVLNRINHAARNIGISRSELIAILIKKMMHNVSNPGRMGKLVRYQQRRGPGTWRLFHVKMRVDDYEYFLDLRRLLKMSVSLILAVAVEKYLAEVLAHKGADNYQFKNYVLSGETIAGIPCWKLIWGFPKNLEKYIAISTGYSPGAV